MLLVKVFCDTSEIQTRNRRLRRALLYSVELRCQIKEAIIKNHSKPKIEFIKIEVSPDISSLKIRMEISTGKTIFTEDTPIYTDNEFRSNRL